MGHSGYELIGSLCEKWMNCKKNFCFEVGKFFAVWTWWFRQKSAWKWGWIFGFLVAAEARNGDFFEL